MTALKPDGTVVEMGGYPGTIYNLPKPPDLVATAVDSGAGHAVAMKADGSVVAWGDNSSGKATPPVGLSGVVSVAAGYWHSLAALSDGTVVAWGANDSGQSTVPTGLSGVVSVSAGLYHSLALKANGTVVAWGGNHTGQSTVPPGLNQVIAISAGASHSLALKANGTVIAWGESLAKQVPADLSGVIAISGGFGHSVALKSDGTVVAWGLNDYGQSTVPPNLAGVVSVSAGVRYTVVVCRATQSIHWSQNLIADTTTAPITLLAAATSMLPVSYTSSDPAVATVSGDQLTIVGPGTATITANQVGNTEFAAGSSVQRTLTVRARLDVTAGSDGSVSVDPLPVATDGTTRLYDPGTVVTLTASVITSHYFSSWTGALSGTTNPATVTMSSNRSVGALFTAKQTQIINGLPATGAAVYGDAAITLNGISGGTSGNPVLLASSDPTVATISGSAVSIVGAGTTTITATQAGDTTHLAASPVTQLLTVAPASLTIAADPKVRVYGQANPSLTWTITGLVNGDSAEDFTTPVAIATTADASSPLGTYAITVSDAADVNYDISFTPSLLTVYVLDVSSVTVRGSFTGGRSPTVTVDGTAATIVAQTFSGTANVPGPGTFSVPVNVTSDPAKDPGNETTVIITVEEVDVPVGGG